MLISITKLNIATTSPINRVDILFNEPMRGRVRPILYTRDILVFDGVEV